MRLAPSLFTFVAALSFSFRPTTAGQPNGIVIRVPLERKSLLNSPPPGLSTENQAATRGNNPVGYVNKNFLKAHVANVATKYFAGFAAYHANTGSPHPLAPTVSAVADGVGTYLQPGIGERWLRKKRDDIPLSGFDSNMWMGAISVGTPLQNFTVDFDTGSADLILADQNCGSSCNGHARYDPAASSTSVDLGKAFQVIYRGGADVNGTQYADNVYMGGYEAVNQTLGSATTYSSALGSQIFGADGLLGMSFPSVSVMGSMPVFQTMISNGVVPQQVFGFALSLEAGKSELTIGGTNTDLYQESTTNYIDVSLPAYWQIPLAGVTRPGLNGTSDVVVVDKTSYAQAFVDTGSTLIITSDSNAKAFYADVPGAKPSTGMGGSIWSVPCDTIDSLVPTFTFGSRNFTVSPSTFNLGLVSKDSTDCVAGVAGGGDAYWIIGDVFLQNVYTIFDVANQRVGFADLV